jgi:hypothetical protein
VNKNRVLGNDVAIIDVEDEKLENAFHSEVRKLRHHLRWQPQSGQGE